MDNLKQPKISICIPVYNCEKFIGAAIESVLAQSYKNYELIILNNCSTDNTAKIIGKYNDSRIRVVDQKINIGAAGNWNCALRESSGKYLKILCADDIIYPDCILKQVECLESSVNRGVVLTCSRRDVIDEIGRKILTRGFRGVEGVYPGCQAIRKTLRAGTNLVGEMGAVLFRVEALPAVSDFDGEMGYVIDLDFLCRLMLLGDIFIEPKPLCAYRVISGSWSINVADSQSLDFSRLMTKFHKEFRCELNNTDMFIGKWRARINKIFRMIFYKVYLKNETIK